MFPALLGLAGGIMSGIGAYKQGQSQGAQLDFNTRQTQIDGMIAQQNAEQQAKVLRKQGRMLTGQQRTRYAISGVRMEGTPLEVMAKSIENVELDAINIRQEGIWRQKQSRIQAGFMSEQADQARTAGTIGMISGFLGGGASAAGMWK